jgi:hypothetical protein
MIRLLSNTPGVSAGRVKFEVLDGSKVILVRLTAREIGPHLHVAVYRGLNSIAAPPLMVPLVMIIFTPGRSAQGYFASHSAAVNLWPDGVKISVFLSQI